MYELLEELNYSVCVQILRKIRRYSNKKKIILFSQFILFIIMENSKQNYSVIEAFFIGINSIQRMYSHLILYLSHTNRVNKLISRYSGNITSMLLDRQRYYHLTKTPFYSHKCCQYFPLMFLLFRQTHGIPLKVRDKIILVGSAQESKPMVCIHYMSQSCIVFHATRFRQMACV